MECIQYMLCFGAEVLEILHKVFPLSLCKKKQKTNLSENVREISSECLLMTLLRAPQAGIWAFIGHRIFHPQASRLKHTLKWIKITSAKRHQAEGDEELQVKRPLIRSEVISK